MVESNKSTTAQTDYLKLSNTKEIKAMLNNEPLLFSSKIIKISKNGKAKERVIIISSKGIYTPPQNKVSAFFMTVFKSKKKLELNIIRGITIKEEDEFIIHGFDHDTDRSFISGRSKQIIFIISQAFFALTKNKITLCQIHGEDIKKYITTEKEKKKDVKYTRMDLSLQIDVDKYLSEETKQVMGNDQVTDCMVNKYKDVKNVQLSDFKVLHVLGRGAYGKVSQVQYLPTKEIFAMKSLKKNILLERKQVKNTLTEKDILENTNHPFLCHLVFCFQTVERVFFVMPFLGGGELFQHLRKEKRFDQNRTIFYAAQIALGLEHLHENNIIYRDLKLENILLDEKGYLKLADFGISRKLASKEKADSFCGTPEYMAPEVIQNRGYTYSIDWWALGILIYQMLCGCYPFYDENYERTFTKITDEEVKFPSKVAISPEAKEIISLLLIKNPNKRLGTSRGLEDLKNQRFFSKIDFSELLAKKIEPQFIPQVDRVLDNFDQEFTSEVPENSMIPMSLLKEVENKQYQFQDFDKK